LVYAAFWSHAAAFPDVAIYWPDNSSLVMDGYHVNIVMIEGKKKSRTINWFVVEDYDEIEERFRKEMQSIIQRW